MKKVTFVNTNVLSALSCMAMIVAGCERDFSDDVQFATFPKKPDVFIDSFSGGLDYLPFAGSKLDAFSVDTEEFYSGTSSMRFDVPNVGDPAGTYAGAIFPDEGGRNLTGYDALTFWAKATQAGTINEIGFGNDFGENKFLTTLKNLRLTTTWTKYVIPIPDPSRLVMEKGLFWYAEGPENENGYTFWIDELKYEKLGTVAQPRPAIMNGEEKVVQSFIGVNTNVTDLTQTFNLENGQNQLVTAAPAYFVFTSSNTNVARVTDAGLVTIIGTGTTKITATLNGVPAKGSLTVQSLGNITLAPVPTRNPANVISVFSDAYTNIPVDFYNGFFAESQTTLGGADINVNGDRIIQYTKLNFVATEFKNPTVNVSQMTHLHVDFQIREPLTSNAFITIQLGDFGPNAVFGGGDDTSGQFKITRSNLTSNQWISRDIPLSSFTGLTRRNNMAQIFFISADGSSGNQPTVSTIWVDNMYFYKN